MEESRKAEETEESPWEEHSIGSRRIGMNFQNEDYSGKSDIKLELNEKLDGSLSSLGIEEGVIDEKGNISNDEDRILSQRNEMDDISMDSPSLIDVKTELSNSSYLEDYRNGDEERRDWVEENGEYSMDDEKCGIVKVEMDDSFPECSADETEVREPKNIYCKYCEINIVSKNLKSHLKDCHKDECRIEKLPKNINCRFCGSKIFSKNFMRHLERQHYDENDVKKILVYPKNTKERRNALGLFRNNINFDFFVTGEIRSYRKISKEFSPNNYSSCVHCKCVYTKRYLKRHGKSCFVKEEKLISTRTSVHENRLSRSKILSLSSMEQANLISKMNVKKQVFHLMKADLISSEAQKDILIAHIGEHFLNNDSNKHINHTVINKMRELSCLLMAYRALVKKEHLSFIDIIDPNNFPRVVKAIKTIAAYDYEKNRFNCPNLASNICNSLKLVCTELVNLISKEMNMDKITKTLDDQIEGIQKVNMFKGLLETRWNAELICFENVKSADKVKEGSSEKVRKKPSLFHLADHLKQFQGEVLRIAYECQKELFINSEKEESYKLLVQASLALLYLSNKRNVEEIQLMRIEDYLDDKDAYVKDFESVLSHVERVLTTKHRRVLVAKQGGDGFLVLIPYIIHCFIDVLLEHRDKYLGTNNRYVFAIPGGNTEWSESGVAIKNLCEMIKLDEKSIGSNKFSKYTGTIMGILNLSQGELQQFGHFMGCALETDNQFFELPLDAHQTAKLARLLQIMEDGPIPSKYSGKCLAEIDIDPNDEFAGEDDEGDDEPIETAENCIEETNEQDLDTDIKEICLLENERTNENSTPFEGNETGRLSEKDQCGSVISFEKLMKLCDDPYYKDEFHDSTDKIFKIRNKKILDGGGKRGWTDEEIELIERDFGYFIQSGVYPPGKEMSNFLSKNNITKTVPILRSKIQHLIRIKNKF